MLETQIAFEKTFVSAFPDAQKLAALFAADAVLWNVGDKEVKGREAIQAAFAGLVPRFDGLALADSRMWTKGNTVVVQWVITGVRKATGKPVSVTGADVFTFNDEGLIVTDHGYTDDEIILKQSGEYKGPTPAPPLLPLPTVLEVHSARNDATEQANAASLVAAQDAFRKKDDKGYFGFIADDLVWYDFSENGVPPRDKKFYQAGIAAQRKAIDASEIKDVNVIAVEDFTIDEQEFTFTQKADFNFGKVHVANTKKTVTVHALEIDQWKDGKMQATWNFTSNAELDQQLGMGPFAKKTPPKPGKPAAKK